MERPEAWHLTDGILHEQRKGDPFAAAVRATRMPMIITDPRQDDNPIVFANDAFLQLTGYDRDEVIGRNCRFLQGEGTDREAVRNVREAIAARQDITVDLLNYRKDGTPFHNSLYISPVTSESGEIQFFFASQFDITAQTAAQEALKQRETELRLIVESATDYAVITTDPERRVTSWSKGAQQAFGWTANEMMGRAADALFTPEDQAVGRPEDEVVTAAREGCANDERWHQRKDGSRVFMNGSVHPLPCDEQGREQGFLKIARDETDRRQTDERLRESEEFNRRILAASADCIKVIDLDGRLEFMSEGGMGVMEVDDFAAISGAYWPDFWQGEEHPKAVAAVAEARRGGTGRFQGFATTMQGSPRWWDVIVTPINGADGRPEKLLSVSRDVSAAKQAEEGLRESEARLRFMGTLDEGLSRTTGATSAMAAAAELLGRHLTVSRCAYADVDADNDGFVIRSDYTAPGIASSAGSYSLDLFGPRASADMRQGRTLVVRDVTGELAPGEGREMFTAIGIEAIVCCPLVKEGRLVAMMAAHQDAPRDWQADEIALVEATVERCWAHVERVGAEARLRESEERLRLATENAEVGFWDVDVVRDILIWPPRVKAMFGISADVPVTMQDFYDGLHPDDREKTDEAYAGAADSDRRALYDVEYRTIGKEDGVVRWVAAKGRGVFDDRGRCVRVLGTAVDITARKRTEERLHDLNATLERRVAEQTAERNRVWEMSRDLFAIMGFDGYLKVINPAWTTTLGFDQATLLSRPFSEQVHPDDHEAAGGVIGRLSKGESIERFDDRLRHADGSWRWISWTVVPEGDVFYAVGRDITGEKQAAEALARTEEALRQSQKMEAVGQLTGGLAHDFNNLLAGISGSLELLGRQIAQGRFNDTERYVAAALGAAKRAASLTHRLLAFSRRQTLDPKPTDVNRLVASMDELVRRTVGPEIEVEVVAAGGLWPTLVDPNQLENALLNLCINARDAMPRGGKLTIETGNRWLDHHAARERELPPGQYISMCVSDNGTGMSPEVAAKAFDPFFTTKPIGQGTGLGLSMIYGFARQSGGQARIYSEPCQGTMVCLYLPRHLGAAENDDLAPELADAPRAQAGETVLVVDDEPTVRMLVTEVLEELGYGAIEAADGASGLKLLQSDIRIDLLVTDVGLPGGMNGRQMADAARTSRPDLKVLFITGYAENAVVGHGHLDQGMHVMTKPFALEALASRIKELIRTE